MGTSWSWVPNEKYKSTDEIIRTLVNVVSRGGSLLLNVAPGPDGQLDSTAYARLKEVGEWLKVNGEAVYGTKASTISTSGDVLGTTECETVINRKRNRIVQYLFVGPERSELKLDLQYGGKPRISMLGSSTPFEQVNVLDGAVIDIPASSMHIGTRVLRIESDVRWACAMKIKY